MNRETNRTSRTSQKERRHRKRNVSADELSLCALASENEIEFGSMGEKPIALFYRFLMKKKQDIRLLQWSFCKHTKSWFIRQIHMIR